MINPSRDPKREFLLAKNARAEQAELLPIRLVDAGFDARFTEETIALPESRPTELRLALLDGAFFILSLGAIFAGLKFLGSIAFNEASFFIFNALLMTGCANVSRYYNLSDGRYSLGKSILVGLTLCFLNMLAALLLTGSLSLIVSATLLLGFAAFSLFSGWMHYEMSRPFSVGKPDSFYCKVEHGIKRAFDFTSALCGMIAVSPLLALVSLLLLVEGKASPLFNQTRIGQGEATFKMYKFRSMIPDAQLLTREQKTTLFKREDDPRITPLGRIIRKLSVDELPQLWNVVRGEMSLVGPRPPLPHEYELMSRYHRRKFEATPGLTGLWQIVGRVKNQRDFNSVAAYDVYYIENWCLIEDLKILFKTIPVVLLQKGAC